MVTGGKTRQISFIEVPRVRASGVDEIAEIVRRGLPVIVEEAENPEFQRLAPRFGLDRFREIWGDRVLRVQRSERGPFDINEPFALQTEDIPFPEFAEKIENPPEDVQYYLRLSLIGREEPVRELLAEARELGRALPLTRFADQDLNTFWLGGKGNITPLHYDDCARSHGTISGSKSFVMFPPDYRHYRNLEMFPIRSPAGWYSRVGNGPIDAEHFPKLINTRPYRALCGPGDFLYIPPCWWHYVTVPDGLTVTLSARFTPVRTYFMWYYWRLRLTRFLKGQYKLFDKVKAEREAAAAAPAPQDG